MVLLTTLFASCDTNTGVNEQKCDVAAHFNYLEIRNVVLPLVMLFASCDTDANISGIT